MYMRFVQTVTMSSFYKANMGATSDITAGDCSNMDGAKVVNELTARFTHIIEANPWLCGRLVKDGGDICLSFSENGNNPNDYISILHDDTLFDAANDVNAIWEKLFQNIPKIG